MRAGRNEFDVSEARDTQDGIGIAALKKGGCAISSLLTSIVWV